MEKRKTKIVILLVSMALFLLTIITVIIANNEYNQRMYDSQKPQIFEIEGTAHDTILNYEDYLDTSYRYFMIQDCPKTEEEFKKIIYSFLESYDYKKEIANAGTDDISLHFMIPSWDFPVYWSNEWAIKHNWKYWDGDDIELHRESSEVALVRCNEYGVKKEYYKLEKLR